MVLKLHESLDKINQKITQEKADKEHGFHQLEPHHKNLVLNASAVPPYDSPALSPNEFYTTFLGKKSQFKAKEMYSPILPGQNCIQPTSLLVYLVDDEKQFEHFIMQCHEGAAKPDL
jgi:hypothetical protein